VWTLVSPNWNFDDATYQRTAQAFKNPDYAAVVLYNYRWRIGLIEGERRYDRYEKLLAAQPPIGVPTVTLDAALDPFTPAGDGSTYRGHFTGPYQHRTIANIGHNLPQEAPTPSPRPWSTPTTSKIRTRRRPGPRTPRRSRPGGVPPGRETSMMMAAFPEPIAPST
jgi:Predicted hydrolases or acyltransferases (alpha/beta hydrolase superfamily)